MRLSMRPQRQIIKLKTRKGKNKLNLLLALGLTFFALFLGIIAGNNWPYEKLFLWGLSLLIILLGSRCLIKFIPFFHNSKPIIEINKKNIHKLFIGQITFILLHGLCCWQALINSQFNPRLKTMDSNFLIANRREYVLLIFLLPWLITSLLAILFKAYSDKKQAIWLPTLLITNRKKPINLFFYNAAFAINSYANYALCYFTLFIGIQFLLDGWCLIEKVPLLNQYPVYAFISVICVRVFGFKLLSKLSHYLVTRFSCSLGTVLLTVSLLFACISLLTFSCILSMTSSINQLNLSSHNKWLSDLTLYHYQNRFLLLAFAWPIISLPWASSMIAKYTQYLNFKFTLFISLVLPILITIIIYHSSTYQMNKLSIMLNSPGMIFIAGILALILFYSLFKRVYNFSDLCCAFMPKVGNWRRVPLRKRIKNLLKFLWITWAGLYLFGFIMEQVLLCAVALPLCIIIGLVFVKHLKLPPLFYQA
ncbi:MAG: hypothetical protein JWM09_640 [Francisellaceae bacterium]|nr:hypothetical protein [Francisellaceae bacterium]